MRLLAFAFTIVFVLTGPQSSMLLYVFTILLHNVRILIKKVVSKIE